MPLNIVAPPYPVFTDRDGTPLENGYVYIGVPGQNPEVNPIPVFWDESLTIPAVQPLRTVYGYLSRNGTPAKLYANRTFSMTVKNVKQEVVFSSLSNVVTDPTAGRVYVETFTGDGATVQFTMADPPAAEDNTQVYINGVYQNKDGYTLSGALLTFSEAPPAVGSNIEVVCIEGLTIGEADASNVAYEPAGSGAVTTTVQAKLRETVSVKDFGAVGDGVTDDTAAIQAAIDYCIGSKIPLRVNAGTYNVTPVLGYSFSCLLINGPIQIYGDGQATSIIRTTKVGGALPDSSGVGYLGAITIDTIVATPMIRFSNLTLEGGNTSTVHIFNAFHKAIRCDGNVSPITNYQLENMSIQNFEGEGAYAPNGNVTQALFTNCYFENNGGSMGNTSGSTKYLNCRFVNGFNSSIEMALDANTGALIVDGCSFYNGTQNGGAVIACQGPSASDPALRAGSKFVVQNCTFEYTESWVTSTGAAPYRCSPLSFTRVGNTVIQNNVFYNAAFGPANGHGTMLIRDFNDVIDFSNNNIIISDSFFYTGISAANAGTTQTLQLRDNAFQTTSQYNGNTFFLDTPSSGLACNKYVSNGNVVQLLTDVAFTATTTTVNSYPLMPYRTITAVIELVVATSVASKITIFKSGFTQDLIDEVLPTGRYIREVQFTTPNTTNFNQNTNFNISCIGDTGNTFSMSLRNV